MFSCVQCGYCCSVTPCAFGMAGTDGGCVYLTEDNLCARYDELKDNPKAYYNPAFGSGCCSPLFNTRRQQRIKELRSCEAAG